MLVKIIIHQLPLFVSPSPPHTSCFLYFDPFIR